MKPSDAAVWIGSAYVNEYSAAGRLVASTITGYGGQPGPTVKRAFTEDADGRCARIESTQSTNVTVETRTYDANGRLMHGELSGQVSSSTDLTYDDQGRILSKPHRGPNSFGGGTSSSSETHTYLPDGSERVAYYDGFTDVTSERNRIVTRTAVCLAIDAEIGVPPDARCRSLQ